MSRLVLYVWRWRLRRRFLAIETEYAGFSCGRALADVLRPDLRRRSIEFDEEFARFKARSNRLGMTTLSLR